MPARPTLATLVPPSSGVHNSTYVATAADGASLELRWYTTDTAGPGSAVVYAHGGGMILGSIDLYNGCEAIHLRRDQDDPTRIVSFTQWATRQHYVDYVAWRTETGLTDELGDMLTEPMSIEYFDDIVSVTR
jgi:quinol monooxygenase YgiN